MNEKLGENEDAVKKYLQSSKKLYEQTGNFFLNYSLHQLRNYFTKNFIKAFTGFSFSHLTKNLNQYNQLHFSNKKTVQIFNRFATYNGSSPYKAPAMLSLIPHLEHNDGVYYPKGGMISITNALSTCFKKRCAVSF